MELPTYTNIWKIEKRLYKLYDFRLPMPLPVGQVAAFLAIAVPYTVILTMAGMPFSHSWLWLYVLPPGALAWLVTRPVLEGKRLPELVLSQLRYLAEPRVWCRMAPFSEPDQIVVVARVWRSAVLASSDPPVSATALDEAAFDQAPLDEVAFDRAESAEPGSAEPGFAETARADVREAAEPSRPVWPTRPSIGSSAVRAPKPARPAPEPARAGERGRDARPADRPVRRPPVTARTVTARTVTGPTVTVRTDGTALRQPPPVERALRAAPDRRNGGWGGHVVVTPGGYRPGKPDLLQRDRGRARMPLPGPARIVVLGCTAGAGQTVTTLLTGQLLASIRDEAVAVLDLSPGPGSLTEQARMIPRLLPSRRHAAETAPGRKEKPSARERGLQVVTAARQAGALQDAETLIDSVVARYPLTLADPAAGQVPRALHAADQLVLVAPASADGPGALAMTREWLEAHGHGDLALAAVIVLNGVAEQTSGHADRMAAVAAGQCRAVVRVPWDSRLGAGQAIGAGTVHAYTALAGVLVAGLAEVRKPVPAGAPDAGRDLR